MSGSEKNFENQIKAYLKHYNCYYVKFFANGFTKRGVPDILACINGYFVGIEVKADAGKPSDLQIYNIEQIRKCGGYAWVVYPTGYPKLKQLIDRILDGKAIKESEVILK